MSLQKDNLRADFDIGEEFDELDTKKKINKAALRDYDVLDQSGASINLNRRYALNAAEDEAFRTGLESLDDENLKQILSQSYKDLAEKNNISLGFKSFSDVANHLGDYSEKDSKFAKLWLSKMVNMMTDTVQSKSAYSLGFLMDKILSLVVQEAQQASIADLETLVASTREILDWQKRLDELKDKYYIAGADRMITEIAEGEDEQTKEKLSNTALNDIVSQLNANAKKKKSK